MRNEAIKEIVDPLASEIVEDGRPVAVVLWNRLPHMLRSHGRRDALGWLQLLLQLGIQLFNERLGARKALDGAGQQGLIDLVEEGHAVVEQGCQGGLPNNT